MGRWEGDVASTCTQSAQAAPLAITRSARSYRNLRLSRAPGGLRAAASVVGGGGAGVRRETGEQPAVVVVGREEIGAHELRHARAMAQLDRLVELADAPFEHRLDGVRA